MTERMARAVTQLLLVAAAAASASAETTRVVAGSRYAKGGAYKMLFGADYRALWTTPATFEVLDLGSEAGGLTPVSRVGGQQSKVLALKGARREELHVPQPGQGRQPDPRRGPPRHDHRRALRGRPGGAASGRRGDRARPPRRDRHTLPAVEAGGPARRSGPGAVPEGVRGGGGWLRRLPERGQRIQPGLPRHHRDHRSPRALPPAQAGGGDEVDVRALLKARLMDIFMGDWDRHRKQWRWARFPDSPVWVPLPEDRDQAFSRYEGLILDLNRARAPRLQKLGPRYPGIGGLTENGREQDRQLLAGLTRDDFRKAATALRAQLTDEAIDRAVGRMPAEWKQIDGARLAADLKARRDALGEVAEPVLCTPGRARRRVPHGPSGGRGRAAARQRRPRVERPLALRRRAGRQRHVPAGLPRGGDGRDTAVRARRRRSASP